MKERTERDIFHNNLRILMSIDLPEVPWMTVEEYQDFSQEPWLWFIRAGDETVQKLWDVIQKRQPK